MKDNNTNIKEVIIATGTLGGGGAERVFLNIANELSKRDFHVRILVTGTKKAQSYHVDEAITIEKIISKKKNKILKVVDKFIKFRKYFKDHDGATVISFFSDVSAYCILSTIGLNIRNVVSERNDPYTTPQNRFKHILRDIVFNYADWCVFQTENAKKYFGVRIQKKSSIINNPMDLELVPQVKPGQKKYKTIIGVGRINPQKNFLLLIKSFERIMQEFPEYDLKIYGELGNKSDEVIKYIREHSLEKRVKLMGFTDKIYDRFLESEIYVLSSDYEGVSNTMLEALAIGIPTIATDCPIGGSARFIRTGQNGILVSVGNEDEMSAALKKLIESPKLREKLSRNSVEIRNVLTVTKICDEWVKII